MHKIHIDNQLLNFNIKITDSINYFFNFKQAILHYICLHKLRKYFKNVYNDTK